MLVFPHSLWISHVMVIPNPASPAGTSSPQICVTSDRFLKTSQLHSSVGPDALLVLD